MDSALLFGDKKKNKPILFYLADTCNAREDKGYLGNVNIFQ